MVVRLNWNLDGVYGMHVLWVGISAWQDNMGQQLLLVHTFIVYKLQNLGPSIFGTGVLQWLAIYSNRYWPIPLASLPSKFQFTSLRLCHTKHTGKQQNSILRYTTLRLQILNFCIWQQKYYVSSVIAQWSRMPSDLAKIKITILYSFVWLLPVYCMLNCVLMVSFYHLYTGLHSQGHSVIMEHLKVSAMHICVFITFIVLS